MSLKDIIDVLDIDQETATTVCKAFGGLLAADMAFVSVASFRNAVKISKAKKEVPEEMKHLLPSVGNQIATGTICGLAAAAAGYITAKAFDAL